MRWPDTLRGGSDELTVDVLVVGAGVAGLVAALDILDADDRVTVALVDKGAMGTSGSTPLAQGGMAAAVGRGDSPALHAADTLRAGDGLGDPRAVGVLAAEAPDRIRDLLARGVVFDRAADGSLALSREGGQRVPRSVRAADATGAEIFRRLRDVAVAATRGPGARLGRIQGVVVSLTGAPDGRVTGGWVLLDDLPDPVGGPAQTAGLVRLRGRAVVLATGGCGGLYAATTNRDSATADGVALAAAAGAHLVDLEFVQFHPTGLRTAGDGFWRFLLTEALRGAGAHLVDAHGHRFMPERHPDGDLAPRHVVTRGILEADGGAWLDATGIPADRLATEFPTVLAGARRFGHDLATAPVPVEPCQHYMIGGVVTDLHGRASVAGLWAAGEVANPCVHGANRMAGNSLAQSTVFAHRAARSVLASLADLPPDTSDAGPPALAPADDDGDLPALRAELRLAMTAGAGPIRTAESLAAAGKTVQDLSAAAVHRWGARSADQRGDAGPRPPATRAGVEFTSMLAVARLIVDSAAARTESRGVHWRDDAPGHRAEWADRHIRIVPRP